MTKVCVFDIDGTIANIEHRRGYVASRPKNWPAFQAGIPNDTPYEDIVWLLNAVAAQPDVRVILCSARSEDDRAVTETWLRDHNIGYHQLYMRASRDYRRDSVVKIELLQQIRADHGAPWLWIDDRNQVVDAIRSQGVRVLQVAPGDF